MAAPVALNKACFLAEGGTRGFGPALGISFLSVINYLLNTDQTVCRELQLCWKNF